MKKKATQTPQLNWPPDLEDDWFDEDDDDAGSTDDLPGVEPRQARRTRKTDSANKNLRD